MATSGETYGTNFTNTGLEGDSFTPESLFHRRTSQPGSSVFPFYDEGLDSAECVNAGEKMGSISRAAYLKRKTGRSPDMSYIRQNTRESVVSVLDHSDSCNTLPPHQSDDIASFMLRQDASYDDKFSSRLNYNGAWNISNCDQLPRAVPSNDDLRYSTDSFMVSNHLQSSHLSSNPYEANRQTESVYSSDASWSSFATIDPLNRLAGFGGGVMGEREHHSKMTSVSKTPDSKVDAKFESNVPRTTNDDHSTKLPEGLNCKRNTVLPGYVQSVPSVRFDSERVSRAAARGSIDPYQQPSCGLDDSVSKKSDIGNVLKATPVGAEYHADGVNASDLETSSKKPATDVNVSRSDNSGRVSNSRPTGRQTEASKKPTKQEPFFDPRRIFAAPAKQMPQKACSKLAKPTAKSAECKQNSTAEKNTVESCSFRKTSAERKASSAEQNNSSVLNNKSPSQPHSGQSLDHGQFIRNDLSDDWKHNNIHARVDAPKTSHHQNFEQPETNDSSRIHETVQRDGMGNRASCRKVENEFTQNVKVKEDHKIVNKFKKFSSYLAKIDRGKIYSFLGWALYETSLLVVNIIKLVVGVILHEIFCILYYICRIAWQGIKWFHVKFINIFWTNGSKTNGEERPQWNWAGHTSDKYRNRYLSENISLPESGDEAIRRLFSCEGKDPYSILGLKVNCTDEEIRKYYRRQAVLVHPDKNSEPGAEEAFKILNHAFEMIGEPEKRQTYDAQVAIEQEDNAAKQQFSDLLTKLHETMQEAMQYMGCSGCGGKHKRIPVDILAREARYCSQCNLRHSAKEGDVWAETSTFGFIWHYYACMEGDIYDITEWASCQSEKFRHVPANSHSVLIHISTGRNRQQRTAARDAESELKDFLNSMYGPAAGRGNAAGPYGRGSYSPDGASAGSGSGSRRRHRRRR